MGKNKVERRATRATQRKGDKSIIYSYGVMNGILQFIEHLKVLNMQGVNKFMYNRGIERC